MKFDVAIVGAGPVGLFSAVCLSEKGMRVLVLERNPCFREESRAIGLSPATLEILDEVGLADRFLEQGVRVDRCLVRDESELLGILEFGDVPSAFPFFLALPQQRTLELLSRRLQKAESVHLEFGREVVALSQRRKDQAWCIRTAANGVTSGLEWNADYLLGCDGASSRCRRLLGLKSRTLRSPGFFVMGDTPDSSGLGSDARLYFTSRGALESFPLPGGGRRWIAQVRGLWSLREWGKHALPEVHYSFEGALLSRLVKDRSGCDVSSESWTWLSDFGIRSTHATQWFRQGAVILGDAAHAMSPAGGQGLNVGLMDAYQLCRLFRAIPGGFRLDQGEVEVWNEERARCAKTAIRRAWAYTAVGTLTGRFSRTRSRLIRAMLGIPMLHASLARHFAQLTLPHSIVQGMRGRRHMKVPPDKEARFA